MTLVFHTREELLNVLHVRMREVLLNADTTYLDNERERSIGIALGYAKTAALIDISLFVIDESAVIVDPRDNLEPYV